MACNCGKRRMAHMTSVNVEHAQQNTDGGLTAREQAIAQVQERVENARQSVQTSETK